MAVPFVGTNVDHAGEYSAEREAEGPNAQNLYSNLILTDFDARYLNKDVLYSGTPGKPVETRTDIICTRIWGHDAGRAFISVTVGKNITVDTFRAEKVAHTMCNIEPGLGICENIQMRNGEVGRAGYFMFSSKGNQSTKCSATFEDIVQMPGETVGNLFWAHAMPVGYDGDPAKAIKKFTLRRIDGECRGDISDVTRITDNYGVRIEVPRAFDKPIYAINCALDLTDTYANGKLVTLNDIQWQWTDSRGAKRGIEPLIRPATGWEPGDIEPPPDPEPVPDEELARLRIENVLLALDRDAKAAEIVRLNAEDDVQDAVMAEIHALSAP
jgi:hypothetical protein